jgi:hypothetical protein
MKNIVPMNENCEFIILFLMDGVEFINYLTKMIWKMTFEISINFAV